VRHPKSGEAIVTKEFYTENDLDELGLLSKPQRIRLRKAGLFPAPIKFTERGKCFYTKEQIDAIKALAGTLPEPTRA
jgi:hypothetical protein